MFLCWEKCLLFRLRVFLRRGPASRWHIVRCVDLKVVVGEVEVPVSDEVVWPDRTLWCIRSTRKIFFRLTTNLLSTEDSGSHRSFLV